MGNFLPRMFFPEDIRTLQEHLRGDVESTNETVKSCTTIDDATKASWNDFYSLAMGYATLTVDGAGIDYTTSLLAPLWSGATLRDLFGNSTDEVYNRGLALEAQLGDWQKKLSDPPPGGSGCPLKGPLHRTPPDPPSDALTALKWGTIAIVAVAGAYGISKLVPAIVEGAKAVSAEAKALGGHLKSKGK